MRKLPATAIQNGTCEQPSGTRRRLVADGHHRATVAARRPYLVSYVPLGAHLAQHAHSMALWCPSGGSGSWAWRFDRELLQFSCLAVAPPTDGCLIPWRRCTVTPEATCGSMRNPERRLATSKGRSQDACPICGAHQLALDEPPRFEAVYPMPYHLSWALPPDTGDGLMRPLPAIVCGACGTRWRDLDAFHAGEPDAGEPPPEDPSEEE